jgi:copper chaperone CopZ
MRKDWANALRVAGLVVLLSSAHSLRAEYLRVELRVYGLDCELCARGVSESVQRMPGVKSVDISLKTGLLEIVLAPGNNFKMSDLRKRIRENGFRPMEATVTARGEFSGPKFQVSGSNESYDVAKSHPKDDGPIELTFDVR